MLSLSQCTEGQSMYASVCGRGGITSLIRIIIAQSKNQAGGSWGGFLGSFHSRRSVLVWVFKTKHGHDYYVGICSFF